MTAFPIRRRSTAAKKARQGASLVEFAVVMPVFLVFFFGILEYGRMQMVANLMQTACRDGARFGSTNNVTTDQVVERVRAVMSPAVDSNEVTVLVKNAGVYDGSDDLPESGDDFEDLDDIELGSASSLQLFLVRASIRYNDVALLNLPWMGEVQITGLAFMRHE